MTKIINLIILFLSTSTFVFAQSSSLVMSSEPGEYIGQGQNYNLTDNDGTFTAEVNFFNGILFNYSGPLGSFTIEMSRIGHQGLIIGPYPNATRFPFHSIVRNGFDATGFGRVCDKSFSDFTVLDIEIDQSNEVVFFVAEFEQHCESIAAPALTGLITYNYSGNTYPPSPDDDSDTIENTIDNCIDDPNVNQLDADQDGIGDICDLEYNNTYITLDSEKGDHIGQGLFQEFYLKDGVFITSRNPHNGITVDYDGSNKWKLSFAAPDDAEIKVGAYNMATQYPNQDTSEPGLSISGDYRGCNTLTGQFHVLSVEYNSNREVVKFDATFEQYCNNSEAALYGRVAYNGNSDFIFKSGFESITE